MWVVDSSGWLEYLKGGVLADDFEPYLLDTDRLIVPTLVQAEVHRVLWRELGEVAANNQIGITFVPKVRALTTEIAMLASKLSQQYHLALADSIILATAEQDGAQLVTCDRHFAGVPEVVFFPKAAMGVSAH